MRRCFLSGPGNYPHRLTGLVTPPQQLVSLSGVQAKVMVRVEYVKTSSERGSVVIPMTYACFMEMEEEYKYDEEEETQFTDIVGSSHTRLWLRMSVVVESRRFKAGGSDTSFLFE